MYSGENIGLSSYQYTHRGRENDHIGNRIVIPLDVNSDARKVLFTVVTADSDVLANEGVSDKGFMASMD
jgi:hypothetical protein